MKNRWGSYEDYAREIDEEAERKAHDAGECEGIPLCGYCLDDWEEQLEDYDKQAYYNSRGHWVK